MSKCPYCQDFVAATSEEEVTHMNQRHPEEIERRLREAGIKVEDYRQGPDLPSYLTLKELQLVTAWAMRYAMDEFGFADDEIQIGIHVRDRGQASVMPASWVEFSVGLHKFALWRRNDDLYRVNPDGSVGDEPLYRKD